MLKNTPINWQGLGILDVHVDTVDKIALDVAPPRTQYTPVNPVQIVWYVWSM
jgi:hypothetical protein